MKTEFTALRAAIDLAEAAIAHDTKDAIRAADEACISTARDTLAGLEKAHSALATTLRHALVALQRQDASTAAGNIRRAILSMGESV